VSKAFGEYASIFDAFYVEKNYELECNNLLEIATELRPTLFSCLEIGAGSGKFTRELAKKVGKVEAFDLSPAMVELAKTSLHGLENVRIQEGDLDSVLKSEFDLGSFDIITAHFHVVSYFNDSELEKFVEISTKFLPKGGIVAFDFWDGSAVRQTPPAVVAKEASLQEGNIVRISSPKSFDDYRRIEVNFIFLQDTKILFSELHTMYPRTKGEVISLFEDEFDFCGSFDLLSKGNYSQQSYSNLIFFRKKF